MSLKGSPTVSPTTAALWASEPLPPQFPSSMYFLALSQAAPPLDIWMARRSPVTITPTRRPPKAKGPSIKPTNTGANTASKPGRIICLKAARVTISTQTSYFGWALPLIMPLISRNWRRTSETTLWAVTPTAFMQSAEKRKGSTPPINKPTITR